MLYSIETDSYITIPYSFASYTRKLLINIEQLYLIECKSGSIYESEIGNCMIWRQIGESIISDNPYQVYLSYNKGGVYISCISASNYSPIYKFDLDKKSINNLA